MYTEATFLIQCDCFISIQRQHFLYGATVSYVYRGNISYTESLFLMYTEATFLIQCHCFLCIQRQHFLYKVTVSYVYRGNIFLHSVTVSFVYRSNISYTESPSPLQSSTFPLLRQHVIYCTYATFLYRVNISYTEATFTCTFRKQSQHCLYRENIFFLYTS